MLRIDDGRNADGVLWHSGDLCRREPLVAGTIR